MAKRLSELEHLKAVRAEIMRLADEHDSDTVLEVKPEHDYAVEAMRRAVAQNTELARELEKVRDDVSEDAWDLDTIEDLELDLEDAKEARDVAVSNLEGVESDWAEEVQRLADSMAEQAEMRARIASALDHLVELAEDIPDMYNQELKVVLGKLELDFGPF